MLLQKALHESHTRAFLGENADRVAGFVLPAADAVSANTPAKLYEAHGLGFAGSPWSVDAEYLDVVRFAAPPSLYVHQAVGGTDAATAAKMGGDFIDRPPFSGNGFATWSGAGMAPLSFLDEVRLPPGAELWRIARSGEQKLVGVYQDVGAGWTRLDGGPAPAHSVPSSLLGWTAVWQGVMFCADAVQNGIALSSPGEPPENIPGFEVTGRGLWRRVVAHNEVSEFYEMLVTCTWRGQPFRVVESATDQGRQIFRLFYLGHNADTAESLGLWKNDAGVYSYAVPRDDVSDLKVVQNTKIG